MASTTDRLTESRGEIRGRKVQMPASTTIYHGTLVMLNAAGAAVAAAGAAGNKGVVGVAHETSTTGAGETKEIVVFEGEFLFNATGPITRADENSVCYASDNDTVATADTGDRPRAGRISQFVDGTHAWVRVGAEFQD